MSGVFGRAFINSLLVCTLITLGQVFTSSLAAYAFARLEFPGRDKLFLAYLATMMVPGAVTMIPLFVILKSLPTALNFLFHTNWFGVQLFVKLLAHLAGARVLRRSPGRAGFLLRADRAGSLQRLRDVHAAAVLSDDPEGPGGRRAH